MELVHSHIARQPVPPGDRLPGVPRPVSAIIMKLLAKTAEERYQTAAGAARDLRRCLDEWETQHRIDEFPLGEQDTPDRLLIPEKLYGRESEIDALLAAFDRVVAGGRPELVLVSGYSGIGKSSVVNELHKLLVPPRGLFAAGKFDQYKRDVPYATLAQAFQMLVRQILVKSEAEVDHWRHALLEALGPNGQLMVNLIPEVEFVIGKQPPVVELPPQEARGRFQLVFRRFLGVFARPEHPLALFLDDLQWLDTATLELLERLITDPDVRHVLFIGAYRDNEVSSSHPLMQTARPRSVATERGCKKSCWRLSDPMMSADWSPIPCAASGGLPVSWRSWSTRRPAATHSSRSSFFRRWPKKGCSGSTGMRPAGSGTWIGFAPRATPPTWRISCWGSSGDCPTGRRPLSSNSPASETWPRSRH